MRIRRILVGIAALAALAGCEQPGANLQANVYRAGQVNQVQEAKVVNVLAILPAKIEVNNQQARATAQILGGLVGGIGGALIGNSVGRYHTTNSMVGGVTGGA